MDNNNLSITDLNEASSKIPLAAKWFHSKWGIPESAYNESMRAALCSASGVPRWYAVFDGENNIVAGLGVIENDFHKRKDLKPNIAAVYVEPAFRKQGIARELLSRACDDLKKHGVDCVYLLTDHTNFYEHCGWTFFETVEEDGGGTARLYKYDNRG